MRKVIFWAADACPLGPWHCRWLATALDAATFIGAPQQAFAGDLTYLILNLGGILAAIIVAVLFIPTFYKAGTLTIYGYLGQRFGPGAMIGAEHARFCSVACSPPALRLFMAGIAFSLLLFNDISLPYLLGAIVVLGIIGTLYTCIGGIKAVIWTDVVQIFIVVGAALVTVLLLKHMIPLSFGEMVTLWQTAPKGDKLHVLDLSTSPDKAYTLWTALFAIVFFNVAAYGTDQDLAQRMLTCRSSWRGSLSLISAILAGIPVTLLFMFIGLLLFIFYKHPELMGAAAPTEVVQDSRSIYPQFLLHHLPTGLSGLAMAGLFAAAMSSFDSAINAMASTVMADLFRSKRQRFAETSRCIHCRYDLRDQLQRGVYSCPECGWDFAEYATEDEPQHGMLAHSRLAVAVMGVLLTIFAILAAVMQQAGGQKLIGFALGVMSFAYAGLLGVFLTALLTRRGNTASVWAALIVGALTVLAVQPYVLGSVTTAIWGEPFTLAWPWWMVLGTTASFVVCVMGRRPQMC